MIGQIFLPGFILKRVDVSIYQKSLFNDDQERGEKGTPHQSPPNQTKDLSTSPFSSPFLVFPFLQTTNKRTVQRSTIQQEESTQTTSSSTRRMTAIQIRQSRTPTHIHTQPPLFFFFFHSLVTFLVPKSHQSDPLKIRRGTLASQVVTCDVLYSIFITMFFYCYRLLLTSLIPTTPVQEETQTKGKSQHYALQ